VVLEEELEIPKVWLGIEKPASAAIGSVCQMVEVVVLPL
jgi:hypothetical protein